MADQPASWAGIEMLKALGSIQVRKAARVKLETGPPTLEARLAALVARWQLLADCHAGGGTGEGIAADTMRACARELIDELDR